MSRRRFLSWIGAVAVVLSAAACGEDGQAVDVAALPEVVSFTSSAERIESGGSATLSWQTRNASGVEILVEGGEPVPLGGAAAAEGSVSVSPFDRTTYELVATNADGKKAHASVTVDVAAPVLAPAIGSFTVTPAEVALGGQITLAWTTTNADSIAIADASGKPVDVRNADVAAGQVTLEARASTAYRLVARSAGGEAEKLAQVTVHGAPAVSFSAPADAVIPGQASALTWVTSGATSVRVTAGATVLYEGSDRLSGQVTVNPEITTSYAIVVRGPGGEAHAAATVEVRPVIESFVAQASPEDHAGDLIPVSWRVAGATAVTVLSQAGVSYEAAPGEVAAGNVELPVAFDGSFVLRARSGTLVTEAVAAIDIARTPRLRSVTATPNEVSADADLAGAVALTWYADGASVLEVEAIPGGPISTVGKSPRTDTLDVLVHEDTTFRVTAFNEFGSRTMDTFVRTHLPPVVETFAARPARVGVGETVHLRWDTREATTIVLEKNGLPVAVDPAAVDGTYDDAVHVDSTYVLRSFNSVGFEVAATPILVTVGAPIVVDFAAAPTLVATGHPLVFSWTNEGGTQLTIEDSLGNAVCSTTDLDEITQGSCQIAGPGPGAHVYTLRVVNGVGQVTTQSFAIDATDGPVVTAVTVADDLITFDEPVAVSWQVTTDAAGAIPSVALTDDQGNTYPLGAADPQNGTAQITLPAPGVYVLTLTATTAGTTPDTATVTVDARGIPSVTSLAATPEIVDTQGGTVPSQTQLSWTTAHGASVQIFQLNGAGQPITPPVFGTQVEAEALAGSASASPPPGAVSYLLVVDNGAGRTASGTVSVAVDPADILSFTATPSAILRGETATLEWTTNRATRVTLTPSSPVHTVLTNAFVDASTLPGATQLSLTGDDNYATVNFPAGFTFPWDGVNRTSVRASTNGFLTFSSTTSGLWTNAQFPDSGNSNVHLAVFWDDLHQSPDTGLSGQLWTASGTDAQGPWVLIQWKNWPTVSSFSGSSASLNFQALLRPSGEFEIRFGNMTGTNSSETGRANGNSATVGYQNTTGTSGHTFHFGSASGTGNPWPGGLTNQGWRVSFERPVSGSLAVTPTTNTTYTLTAINGHSSDTATTSVVVHAPVTLNTPTISPAEPVVGDTFTLSWTATGATAIEVLEGTVVRCTATASQLSSGSCSLVEATSGPRTYTVRAVGALARDVQTRTVNTSVRPPLSIDQFTVSGTNIPLGGTVQLNWASTGAASGTLTANGAPLSIGSFVSGTITHTPSTTTTYVFTIQDSSTPARTRTSQHVVTVRTTELSNVAASPAQVPSGGGAPVTLSWNSTGAAHVMLPGVATVSQITAPFIDVSTTGTRLVPSDPDDGEATLTFPAGFVFPFDGALRTQVRVTTNGFLNFGNTSSVEWSNVALPAAGEPEVHIAPFWDDLHAAAYTGATGQIWWAPGSDAEGDYIVVQWKQFPYRSSSSPTALNFEVVLRESGSFEFRYGSMVGSTQARADGSSTTIGFQDGTGSVATVLSHNTAVTGGLSNRSWRFDVAQPANGSVTFTPAGTTYRVCSIAADGYVDCEQITLNLVRAGDVLITEIMAAPGGGVADPAGEWFEIRNTANFPIDVNGWVIGSGASDTPVTIANGGPLVLQPGQLGVFAASGAAANGGIAADYVYGAGPTFNHGAADELTLHFGTLQVDRVAWDATWGLAPGTSLFLDNSNHRRDATRNDARNRWCVSSLPYDGTNLGSPGMTALGCVFPDYDFDPFARMPFIDIATTGTPLPALSDDDVYATVPGGIGFTLPFFSGTTTALSVTSNGLVLFTNSPSDSHWSNTSTVPSSSSPNGYVAPFWDDLTGASGTFRHQLLTVGGQLVQVLQWTNWQVLGETGSITFQVQLWESGDIVTAYRDISGTAADLQYYEGVGATFAIENPAGTAGILASANQRVLLTPDHSFVYRKK